MDTPLIFITDDDFFFADVIATTLSVNHFNNKKIFTNGQSLLNNLYQMPKIVILDMVMPEVSGFDALKEIKSFDPDIFVIMLSGQKDVEMAIQTLKYGAFDYIIKNDDAFIKLTHSIKKIMALEKPRKMSYFSKLLTSKMHYKSPLMTHV